MKYFANYKTVLPATLIKVHNIINTTKIRIEREIKEAKDNIESREGGKTDSYLSYSFMRIFKN